MVLKSSGVGRLVSFVSSLWDGEELCKADFKIEIAYFIGIGFFPSMVVS